MTGRHRRGDDRTRFLILLLLFLVFVLSIPVWVRWLHDWWASVS